ncbi:hypothetical protein RUND412_006463 [Rhizina undulata]
MPSAEVERSSRILGYSLYAVTGAILFFGLICRLIFAARSAEIRYDVSPESQVPISRSRKPSSFMTKFKRNWVVPALFGRKHITPMGWWTFPTRGQTVLIFSYMALNIIFLVVNPPPLSNNDGYERSAQLEMLKFLADRAGFLALYNLPIIFLLAGRNDFLIWLTGWTYGTFHVFHKWIARIAAALALFHSIGYAAYAYSEGMYSHPQFWWYGVTAIIVMVLILCFAVLPIRQKWYEVFLAAHIIGAASFLAFLLHHLRFSSSHSYDPWVWACVALWSFDRLARAIRIALINFKFFKLNRHLAKAKFIKGTDVIQLTVYPSQDEVGYYAGAHFFVYLPDTLRFWESHPFTAAHWRPKGPTLTAQASQTQVSAIPPRTPPRTHPRIPPRTHPRIPSRTHPRIPSRTHSRNPPRTPPTYIPPPRVSAALEKLKEELNEGLRYELKQELKEEFREISISGSSDDEQEDDSFRKEISYGRDATKAVVGSSRKGPARPKLTFLIRPRKGMTATLQKWLQQHETMEDGSGQKRQLEINCLIEGPYGQNRPVHLYETVVLVAGGIGVSMTLAYLDDYIARKREGQTLTRRVVFLWSVKEAEVMERFMRKKLPKTGGRDDIVMKLYVSIPEPKVSNKLPGVKYKRPKLLDTLNGEKRKLVGKMAVLACGPPGMVDATREAVVDGLYQEENKVVDYFEECYGW